MKKFILLFLIVFLASPVYAAEYNMNSHTSGTLNGTKNRYNGTEIYNTGTTNTYTFGTRYNGRLSALETYFDYPFEANTTYTLTYNMATEDFRNSFGGTYWWDCDTTMNATNQHTGNFTYVSYKKVKFSFTPEENTTCIRVLLGSTNVSSNYITGVSNWNLSSITLYDPDYQSGSGGGQGSGSTPTPTPTPTNDYSSIINNQNNNTQDIINNQNENTSDVIDNMSENFHNLTDKVNEILGNCYTNYSSTNSLTINFISGNSGYSFLQPIDVINKNFYIKFTSDYTLGRILIRPYNALGNLIISDAFTSNSNFVYNSFYNGFYYDGRTDVDISLTFNSNVSYFIVGFVALKSPSQTYSNIMISNSDKPFINAGEKVCTSKLDETNTAINDINDSINNSNIENGVGSDFFSDFEDEDFGLSSIITIPLNTIQSLTSKSCVALQVPIPFTNSNVSLPCMTEIYQENIPTIYNLWKIVSFGIIAYFIAIDIFHLVKGFKDPESDKVEVLDL